MFRAVFERCANGREAATVVGRCAGDQRFHSAATEVGCEVEAGFRTDALPAIQRRVERQCAHPALHDEIPAA